MKTSESKHRISLDKAILIYRTKSDAGIEIEIGGETFSREKRNLSRSEHNHNTSSCRKTNYINKNNEKRGIAIPPNTCYKNFHRYSSAIVHQLYVQITDS